MFGIQIFFYFLNTVVVPKLTDGALDRLAFGIGLILTPQNIKIYFLLLNINIVLDY